MDERSATALLTIRAWCEDGSKNPLRAEIRATSDVSLGFQHMLTVADADEVVREVRAFLGHVLSVPGG